MCNAFRVIGWDKTDRIKNWWRWPQQKRHYHSLKKFCSLCKHGSTVGNETSNEIFIFTILSVFENRRNYSNSPIFWRFVNLFCKIDDIQEMLIISVVISPCFEAFPHFLVLIESISSCHCQCLPNSFQIYTFSISFLFGLSLQIILAMFMIF